MPAGKLKSQMLFTFKNFMFSDLTWKNKFAPGNAGMAGTPCHCRRSGIFIVNFEHISHLFLRSLCNKIRQF